MRRCHDGSIWEVSRVRIAQCRRVAVSGCLCRHGGAESPRAGAFLVDGRSAMRPSDVIWRCAADNDPEAEKRGLMIPFRM